MEKILPIIVNDIGDISRELVSMDIYHESINIEETLNQLKNEQIISKIYLTSDVAIAEKLKQFVDDDKIYLIGEMTIKQLFSDFLLDGIEFYKKYDICKTHIHLMTFNIRYGTADDGENNWQNRRGLVFDLIKQHNADIIGLQEALKFQIDEILSETAFYEKIGVGRDDGDSLSSGSH